MKQYFLYIVCCVDTTFYVGITTDLKRRIQQHNGIKKGGAKYTQGRRPVVLVYFKEYTSRSAAQKAEYMFKKLSHKEKEKLCLDKKLNTNASAAILG